MVPEQVTDRRDIYTHDSKIPGLGEEGRKLTPDLMELGLGQKVIRI